MLRRIPTNPEPGVLGNARGWRCSNVGHLPSKFFLHAGIATQPKTLRQRQVIERPQALALPLGSEIRHTIRIGWHRLKRDRSITHVDARVSPQLNDNAFARMSVLVLHRTVGTRNLRTYFLV